MGLPGLQYFLLFRDFDLHYDQDKTIRMRKAHKTVKVQTSDPLESNFKSSDRYMIRFPDADNLMHGRFCLM